MQTLKTALRSWSGRGRVIEIPFPEINNAVNFRTTELAVLAAAPGGGKTLLAVNWAIKSKDKILYLAQDSPRSVLQRLVALTLDKTTDSVALEQLEYWAELVEDQDNLVIAEGAHTIQDIEDKIVALTEWWQEPPGVVFVDNLYNLRPDSTATYMENTFYAEVLPALVQVGLKYDVGIIGMHHVGRSGDHGKKVGLGNRPLRMSELLFGGEREARHVWGVYHRENTKLLTFQVLKQTDGEASPDGNLQFHLEWEPEFARLGTGYWKKTSQRASSAMSGQSDCYACHTGSCLQHG